MVAAFGGLFTCPRVPHADFLRRRLKRRLFFWRSLAVLAVLLFVHPRVPSDTALQASSLGDLELLLGDEDLQMLDEDIEFYGWLEEQPELKGGDTVG